MHPEDQELNLERSKLFRLKKNNVYKVPEGFFAELEIDIRNKYPRQKKGLYRRLMRFAQVSVAAAILTIVLFSGIRIFGHKQYLPVETDRSIYTVEDGNQAAE